MTGAGVLIALVAWLPLVLKRLPLSQPIICVPLRPGDLQPAAVRPLPMSHPEITSSELAIEGTVE